MQNFSQVFQETLNEYESPYVPGDRGDEGKGQVTARAGYKIWSTLDPNVGYIAKSAGQTQYHGITVDALQDYYGYGADYLTDELQPDGRRLIKLAYTEYPPPAAGAPVPPANWVQPTPAHCEYGGPLVLKSDTPDPEPEPTPTPEYDYRFDAIDQALIALSEQLATSTGEILTRSDTNTEKIQTQIHDLVEDVEATLIR